MPGERNRNRNRNRSRNRDRVSPGGSSGSSQIGLNQGQVDQLRGNPGINQGNLNAYVSSGSVVGGRNNPRGRGRERNDTGVITAASIKPGAQINLPTPPAVDGMTGVQDGISASLAGGLGGTFDTTNKQIVPAPATTTPQPDTATQLFQSYLNQSQANFDGQESSVDRLKQQQKMLRPKENAVNALSGQINTITANRDAAMLSLEGQGRGQTSGFIGGEQARINREAAIQAMPVQAQLAIAQDDLESARSYASQLFQAQSQDAQAKYQFQQSLNQSIYGFLNDQEKTRMAANEKALDRDFAVAQANRTNLKQLSMQAIEYGQGALAAEIMKLDPKSATFDADYGDVTSRLRKPVAAVARTSDWEIKDIDGVSMWVNKFTQETKAAGDTALAGIDGPGGELDKVALLRDTISRIKGREANAELKQEAYDPLYKKASQTWTSQFFGRTFTGSSGLDNLKVYADTLKSNMLTLATDPDIKKFFGPQMSNADVQQMMATASRLQPDNMTSEQLLSEVNRIETFVGKYEAAVKAKAGGYTQSSNIVIGADGYEYEIVE